MYQRDSRRVELNKMTPINAAEFFRLIWPEKLLTNELLELRLRRRVDDTFKREFFSSREKFIEKAIEQSKKYDAYFGIATRFGKGGKKLDCYRINTVWADIDNRTIDQCKFRLPPTVLVDSGRGVHAYWVLKQPFLVRGERWEPVEAVNRFIAETFKCDSNTIDVSRILRVPETLNHKFDKPREVRANGADSPMRYSLEDFKKAGWYKEKNSSEVTGEIQSGKVIEDIPDQLAAQLSDVGGGKYNDASRADFQAIKSLLSCGLTPEECYATFAASSRGRDALSRKNGHFDDYVQRTIRSSLSYLKKTLEDYKTSNETLHIDFSRSRVTPEEDGIHFRRTDTITVERPEWLWPGYIPAGKITIIAGDPGMGKSTIAVDLVARISKGAALPTGGRTASGTCLIASAEDAAEDTITPRLIAAEAKLGRVGVIREIKIDDKMHYICLPRDLNRLKDVIVRHAVRMLVIDPLNAFIEKGTDTYKDQDIRSVLAPLENMAEETGVAIVIIAHLNKKEDSSVLYRVGGSIGFIGAARSVLAVATSPKSIKVLYSLKSNLAKKPPALAYETKTSHVEKKQAKDWLGEEKISSSKIRWKGKTDFDPSSGSTTSSDKASQEAENFLRQALGDGECECDEIYAESKKVGIKRATLNDTRIEMGVQIKRGRDGKWLWSLNQS